MADVITRLKVESSEYDSKIQRAAKGLLHMEEACRKVGGTLAVLEDDEKKFVQSLGSMQTVATTVRGKLNELTQAYTELSVQYKRLTDEEKQGDFGKALSASLDQLKTRINDTKAQLNDVSMELGNTKEAAGGTGSIVDELTSKFGLNIKQLAGWGAAAGAAKIAFDVLKDAFFQSESNIDEWGRTVEGAKGAYDVFLNTINSGNWSNFFSNLSTAVQGARDLYDALDRLGSVKSNNQAAIAIQQQQIAQLRLMKQQGQNVDEQLKAATERLRQLQNQSIEAGKNAGHATILNTLQNRVNAANTTGVNISDGTLRGVAGAIENRGQGAFDQYKRQYEALTAKGLETVQKYDSLTKTYYDAQVFNLEKLSKEEQKRYLIAQAVTEGETEIQKGIGIYAQAVSEGTAAAREEFKGNRYALQGTGSGKGTSPQEQAAKAVSDAMLSYQQTIEKARMSLENGTATEADVKKKTLAAEEQLWTAYGKAYNTYADPKYKEAQAESAKKIQELGGEVTNLIEAQKSAKDAAAQMAAAYKKQADAADKMADAVLAGSTAADNNNLAGFYAANKQLKGMDAQTMDLPVNITLTDDNLEAFKANLKEQIAQTDVGTDLYNQLTSQLADATALGTLLQTCVQNGIDTAQFAPQELWQKIFGENPGDYIKDDVWKSIFEQLNSQLKKQGLQPVNINYKTGGSDSKNNGEVSVTQQLGSVLGGVNSIVSGLNALGMEIPEEFSKVITGMQTVISITSSIASIVAAIQVISTANLFKLAGGGIIPAFANGGLIGNAAMGMTIQGNSFSGDNLRLPVDGGRGFIGVNSGELILNRSQQGVLADALQDNGKGIVMQPYVEGDKILLGVNNRLRSHGQGEIVTTSMLRRYGLIG